MSSGRKLKKTGYTQTAVGEFPFLEALFALGRGPTRASDPPIPVAALKFCVRLKTRDVNPHDANSVVEIVSYAAPNTPPYESLFRFVREVQSRS